MNTKISEVENKVPDNSKYITVHEYKKLTDENFETRWKQADLVKKKTDFDNKLKSFHIQISSNKIKHLEIQKKLNRLITKDYHFSFGRICFTSNDESQSTFVYQLTLDALKIKKRQT